MNTGFDSILHAVREAFQRLLNVTPVRADQKPSPIPQTPGVYVFYESEEPLYVGRTGRHLRKRVTEHYRGGLNQAAFAVKLAKEEADPQDPEFDTEFARAKERIAKMDVRCLRVTDPDGRCLLEFYAAKELQTPHNDFRET